MCYEEARSEVITVLTLRMNLIGSNEILRILIMNESRNIILKAHLGNRTHHSNEKRNLAVVEDYPYFILHIVNF